MFVFVALNCESVAEKKGTVWIWTVFEIYLSVFVSAVKSGSFYYQTLVIFGRLWLSQSALFFLFLLNRVIRLFIYGKTMLIRSLFVFFDRSIDHAKVLDWFFKGFSTCEVLFFDYFDFKDQMTHEQNRVILPVDLIIYLRQRSIAFLYNFFFLFFVQIEALSNFPAEFCYIDLIVRELSLFEIISTITTTKRWCFRISIKIIICEIFLFLFLHVIVYLRTVMIE